MPSFGDDKKEAVEGGYEDSPCKLGFAMDANEDWQNQPSTMKISETLQTGRSKGEALGDLRARCTQTGLNRTLSSVEELAFNCMEKIGGNDEMFSPDDVLAVIKEFENMRTDMRTMKHFFIGLIVCFIVFSGTMFGLMWVSIEMTKDFHPEDNGILKTPDGEAIGTSVVTHTRPLSALAAMTRHELRNLKTIDLTNGTEWSNHKVASVSKTSTAVIVQTQQGRTITANQDGGLFLGDSAVPGGGRRLNADDATCTSDGTTEEISTTPTTTTCPDVISNLPDYIASSGLYGIKINEVDANPPRGQKEFVELYNAGSVEVDLTDWTVTEVAGRRGKFLDGRKIQPKSFLVVTTTGLNNNGGETVQLRNSQGCLVDEFYYTKSSKTSNWARVPDGGAWQSRQQAPTKDASNGQPEVQEASAVGCNGTCDGLCFATWNIQNLGASKESRSAVMTAIRSVIARYDLTAVQELSQMPKGSNICGPNTESVICESRPNATYSVTASPRIGDEQFAIITKKASLLFPVGTSKAAAEFDIGAKYPDPLSVHSRPPYAFKVNVHDHNGAGEWDLVVALTHTSPDQATEEIRNFPAVLSWMEGEFSTSGGNEHFAIVGDYNAAGSYFKDETNGGGPGVWPGSKLTEEYLGSDKFGKYALLVPNTMETTVAEGDPDNPKAYDRIIVDTPLSKTAGTAKVFKLEDIDLSAVRIQGCSEAYSYVPEDLCEGKWNNQRNGGLTTAGVWTTEWSQVDWKWRNKLAKEISDHHPVEICLNKP